MNVRCLSTIVPIVLAAVAGRLSAQAAEWTVAAPTLSVGGASEDPHYQLSGVVGATLLSDGRLVIADHYVEGLRAYDADGTYLKTVGGEGEGPGEYEYIRGMGHCEADRIVAFDLQWSRNIYDLDLTWIEERSPQLPGMGELGLPYQLACEPNGHILATGWGESQFAEGYFAAYAPVVLIRGGEVIHDFGERLSSERFGYIGGSGPHPFGRQTSVAISRDRVFLGDASTYSVEMYDLTGRSLGTIEWEGPDRVIADADYDLYETGVLKATEEERRPAMRRFLRDNLPRLDTFPAYDRLRVDSEGNLWVRSFARPGAPSNQWLVFEPGGRVLGRVTMPASRTVLDIVDDRIVYVEKDDLDIETVHVARLVR